jgi:hypothetical protein
MKVKYSINGKGVTKEEFQKRPSPTFLLGPPMTKSPATYQEHNPLISEGLGCMKSQVPAMREAIRRENIQGVRVQDNGSLEITCPKGRKQVGEMRPIPLYDADAFYG